MTNLQIIGAEMIMHGITEDVDTYAGWSRRGYQVRKGSKALFQTRIWRPTKSGKAEEDAEEENGHLIMVNASFFGKSQVEAKEQ